MINRVQLETATGGKLLSEEEADFLLPGPLALPWQRVYASRHEGVGWLGQGWSLPFLIQLQRGQDSLTLVDTYGRRIPLPDPLPGQSHYSRFERFTLERDASGGRYALVFDQGRMRLCLGAVGLPEGADASRHARAPVYALQALEDNNGNRVELVYGAWPKGVREGDFEAEDALSLLTPIGIRDSAGRRIKLEFAPLGGRDEPRLQGQERGLRLTGVGLLSGAGDEPLDGGPRILARYQYDEEGNLARVQNALGEVTREFGWRNHILVMERDAAGLEAKYTYDAYAPEGKVTRCQWSDGQFWTFDYEAGKTHVTRHGRGGALSGTQTWHHDGNGNRVGYRDELGGELRRELDSFGNLRAVIDEAGHTTRYQLDGQGRPTQITAADGSQTLLHYDEASGQVDCVTTADGGKTRYAYDARGNVAKVTDALGQETCFEYDERGLPVKISDALGKQKHLAYNAAGQLVRYTDCSGQTTRIEYDDWGNSRSVQNALGERTRYQHDPLGRLLRVEYPDGSQERMQYDKAGRLIAYTDSGGRRTEYTLSEDGLPLSRRNALGGELRYEYDPLRRLQHLVNENGQRYSFAYDALSRLTHERGFDGRQTCYEYDAASQLRRKLEMGTVRHDAEGQPVLPLPPGQIETRYERDAMGRLIQKLCSGQTLDATGALRAQARTTRYEYDVMGRLTRARNDEGARVEMSWDALGQLQKETRTGQGVEQALRHGYDALGNRVQTSLPDGRNIHWLYYGSGHLHQIHVDGHVICDFERDNLHREISRSQGAIHSRYERDALGRLIGQRGWRGGLPEDNAATAALLGRRYQYDKAGNLAGIEDLRQGETRYQYDPLGRITSATQKGETERFAFDPAHNLLEPEAGEIVGYVRGNRLETQGDRRYRYDTHGNLVEKKIGKHTTIRLMWDVEQQLTEAHVTRNGLTQRTRYRYDAFGRRIAKEDAFGQTRFCWDGNLLLGEERGGRQTLYLYEPGSFAPLAQLADGVATLAEAANEPQKPEQKAANDDPEDDDDDANWNPRAARKDFEAQTRQLLARMRGEERPGGAECGGIATAQAEPLPKQWQTRYYHTDHLGTPRELTGEDGALLWSAQYQAWGNVLREEWLPEAEPAQRDAKRLRKEAEAQNLTQNLRFQGQYYDAETGLHYNRFRYYDPDCGRFVSQDPILQELRCTT